MDEVLKTAKALWPAKCHSGRHSGFMVSRGAMIFKWVLRALAASNYAGACDGVGAEKPFKGRGCFVQESGAQKKILSWISRLRLLCPRSRNYKGKAG